MKLLISIILIALIVYAVYTAKYLSPRGKKVCTVVAIVIAIVTGVTSGVLPIVGVIVGFKCDLTVASKATEWFPMLWMLGGAAGIAIGVALGIILALILGIMVIIWGTICKYRSRSQNN